MSKSKSSRLSQILDETNPFEIDDCKSRNGDSVSDPNATQEDKFDPPCLQSRDSQYLKDRPDIWK